LLSFLRIQCHISLFRKLKMEKIKAQMPISWRYVDQQERTPPRVHCVEQEPT
jgi:hypothetical protein